MALPVTSENVLIRILDDAVDEQKLHHAENLQFTGLVECSLLGSPLSALLPCQTQTPAEVVVRLDEGHFCSGGEIDELLAEQTGKLQLEIDSLGECVDESGSDASDLQSSRHCSEDSANPNVINMSDEIGMSEQHFRAHVEGNMSVMSAPQHVTIDMDSPSATILTLKEGKPVAMDDASAGHLSDSGAYHWEDSSYESPALLNALSITVSPSVDFSTSILLQNRDLLACGACATTSGEITESIPGDTSNCALQLQKIHLLPATQIGHSGMGYKSDCGEAWQPRHVSVAIDGFDSKSLSALEGSTEEGASGDGLVLQDLREGASMGFESAESAQNRVEKWISEIQHFDLVDVDEIVPRESEMKVGREKGAVAGVIACGGASIAVHQTTDALSMDRALAKASIRSLSSSSSVAHITGLGLREMPLLGLFSSLKTLNLSANRIARIPSGCLPPSLHSLDLSRNKISLIEGFRDVTRLRMLNLSCNRISRIGHGLANCTLIKELYMAGNKIAEIEGLHRLLKLSVLDLSFNKLATSKALGQLAANYSSLLALNLLGNPILLNLGDVQLQKLVLGLAPFVTYLNRQPIKAVSAREAAIDSVARAALGTSQRGSKASAKTSVRVPQSSSSHKKPPSHYRGKDGEKSSGSILSLHDMSSSSKPPRQHRHHHHRHADDGHHNSTKTKEITHSSKIPLTHREKLLRNLGLDMGSQAMHRSSSEGALQERSKVNRSMQIDLV